MEMHSIQMFSSYDAIHNPWICRCANTTIPRSALYSFSYSVYSQVAVQMMYYRMYYKVQLMRNEEVVAPTWEDSREDLEDSSSSRPGPCRAAGRQLCGNVKSLNDFSGSLLHQTLPQHWLDEKCFLSNSCTNEHMSYSNASPHTLYLTVRVKPLFKLYCIKIKHNCEIQCMF